MVEKVVGSLKALATRGVCDCDLEPGPTTTFQHGLVGAFWDAGPRKTAKERGSKVRTQREFSYALIVEDDPRDSISGKRGLPFFLSLCVLRLKPVKNHTISRDDFLGGSQFTVLR